MLFISKFKKKIIYDSLLNIIASSLPLAFLHLIVLPGVGNKVGEERYGLVITLISLTMLLSNPLGNVLNNVRLLQQHEYEEQNKKGDFNVLLLVGILINSIIMIFGTVYYEDAFLFFDVLLIIIISSLNLIKQYLIVAFRIILNYKAILMNNVILGIGYLLGLGLFFISGYWQLIYLTGLIVSIVYIINNSNLIQEGFEITALFKNTTYKSVMLFFSAFIKASLHYADKLILFPLLGPTAVSIYYTATVLGKLTSRIINPVSGVLLSYLVKMKTFKMINFVYLLSITSIIGFIGYIIIIFISKPLLNLLYPQWASESLKLIYITAATAVLREISSIVNPILLCFNKIIWQTLINGSDFIISIVAVIFLYQIYGLLGFCAGMLIASIFRLLFQITVFVFNYEK